MKKLQKLGLTFFALTALVLVSAFMFPNTASAAVLYSQNITLAPGWNSVSTPKVLDSFSFSVANNATNFDIYALNPANSSGWSTMADLGQTTFTPLYGYFVDNKTGSNQTLTFNYSADTTPTQRLFSRTFPTTGWYSFGIANPTYAVPVGTGATSTGNPNQILNSLLTATSNYSSVIDFTDASYPAQKDSVALVDPWKSANRSADVTNATSINTLNDFRETKGYAIFINQAGALYNGFQNNTVPAVPTLVSSITVTGAGSATSVGIGSTLQMNTAILPASPADSSVTWSVTGGTGTATINASTGILTGVTAGTVTVTATANDASGVTGTEAITVLTPTVTITRDASDSTDHTVQVSASSNTQNVTLATIDLSSPATTTITSLPVTVNVANSGSGGTNANSLVSTLRLYDQNGIQLDSESVPTGANPTVTFQNLNLSLSSGSATVLTIKGDINTIDGSIVAGGASVQIDAASETGSTAYFYVDGINVSASGNSTNTYSNPGGSQSHGIFTMTIPFSVTSYGTTSYIPSTTQIVTAGPVNNPTATAGDYIQYAVDNGTNLVSGATATITYTGNNGISPDTNGNYQIPVGQTMTFNLVITYTPSASGSYRGQLVNVNSNTTDASSGFSTYTAGLNTNQFRTAYVAGQ